MGRIKDLTSALPTETDAFVFDGTNGTKKLTYNNLKQIIIDDVSEDIEEDIRQIYVIDNALDESSAHAVANSAVARAVNANSSAIDSINNVMSSLQTSQNNLIDRVDDLEEDLQEQLLSMFVTESTSSSIASFDDGADDVPVKSLVVNIIPKQAGNGDPSPSNVRAISGWTEANIYRYGGNALDLSALTTSKYEQGITFTVNADGSATANGTATAQSQFTWYIPFATAKLYTGLVLSGCPSGCQLRLEKASSPYTAYAIDTGNGATISEPAGGCNLIVRIPSGMTMSNRIIAPQISGFTDGVNRPYNADSTVYNISFGSAGTVYGGTLDVTSGMLTVTHGIIDASTLKNDRSWNKSSSALNGFYLDANFLSPGNTQIWCNQFKYTTDVQTYFQNYGNCYHDGSFNFNCDPSICGSTVASWVAWLDSQTANNTPVLVVYQMNNPISVQLTAIEVRSLLGNNNIWSDTGSVASCEYRADIKLYLEKLTHPDSDMVADANITSGSYFMVGNNLYLATANIANGGAIIPGTNCTATNLAAALNAINT